MKTTFELNFDFYQAFKQHGYTKIWKQREAVNLKSFSLTAIPTFDKINFSNILNLYGGKR